MSRNNHQDFSDTSSNLIDKRYPFQALPISFSQSLSHLIQIVSRTHVVYS